MKATRNRKDADPPAISVTFPNNDYVLSRSEFIDRVKRFDLLTYKGYIDAPCAFDIETSSFLDDSGDKAACMYAWTFGICGYVTYGRTWGEYIGLLEDVARVLRVSDNRCLCVYVHNLGYEFEFIRKRFEWSEVFAVKQRKPLYARTKNGFEYRCSYLLSGYSLARLATHVRCIETAKKTGDLDYDLIRHSETPLTIEEWGYCFEDCRIVQAYINDLIADEGHISLIPRTKTGYVRRTVRRATVGRDAEDGIGYRDMLSKLTIEPDEYYMLKRAFQGGFTHASAFHSGVTLEHVGSRDIASSYPTVMICERFPMSKGEYHRVISREDFEDCLALYCCIFDVTFYDLKPKLHFEHPLSASRCFALDKPVKDNGRIVSAERAYTTITDVDFNIIREYYDFSGAEIGDMYRYRRGYLPPEFVSCVLDLFQAKTSLKGVDGAEVEYMQSKEQLNSCYGMCVTDPVRDVFDLDGFGNWKAPAKPDTASMLDKYNKARERFLFYPWGVYVTAYARRNLFAAVTAMGNDYVYSDTDSVKFMNPDKHTNFFESYNDWIFERCVGALRDNGLSGRLPCALTSKGEVKRLGVFESEGVYDRFKTLGAKRYLVEKDGKRLLTVAGLNKQIARDYLEERFGENIFDGFSDGLYIPPGKTGKQTHTYLDYEQSGILTDYLGNPAPYHELSSIHLSEADYSLGLGEDYRAYLLGYYDERL